MPVASRWLARATIRGHCKPTSAIATSSTRCATPSCRRIGSRTSGGRRELAISELILNPAERGMFPVLDLDPLVTPAAAVGTLAMLRYQALEACWPRQH